MNSLIRLFGLLALAGLRLHAASFTSGGPITFPDTSASRQASPYPSTITVSGVPLGTITNVTVTLSNLTHPRPDDIEILLVSPWGAKLVIVADVGGTVTPVSGLTITLSDAAASLLPDSGPLTSGTFKPTCVDNLNNIATEFPGQTVVDPDDTATPSGSATFTSVFGGSHDPNGVWNLYVVDDVSSTDTASFGSWTINVGTSVTTVGTFTALTNTPNPSFLNSNVTFTATVRKQTDSNVVTTGTVTFREGATTLAGGVAVNGSGQASFSTTILTEGAHVITADYTPGAGFLASTATRTQSVDRATIRNGNTFCNVGALTLSAVGSGTANVYPSHIFVSALTGNIAKVTLTISNLTINRPDDLSLLLVGPSGANFLVLNDAGGTASGVAGVNLTFDDAAANLVPDVTAPTSGTWRPSSYNSTALPLPAPAPPYNNPAPFGSSTFTNVFNASDPNGTWSLYAFDDVTGDGGTIAGGWCLSFIVTTNASTTTSNSSSANPSLAGAPVTFTATVRKASDNSLVTVGNVTFREGLTILSGAVALNGSGQAAFSTSSLTEGQHVITAEYSGAVGQFNTSLGSVTQIVDNATLVTGSTFCNTGAIQVVSGQTAASVYPSRINVSGIGTNFCKLSVTVSNLSIDVPDDVELLLVSPNGTKFVVLSDAGGVVTPVSNVSIVFRDDAASLVADSGPMTSGAFRPTDVGSTPANFPAPAPAAPYAHPAPTGVATLNGTFAGGNANGYWSLYAVDDVAGGQALSIAKGWCLSFTIPQIATVGGPQSICTSGTTAGLGGNTPVSSGAWSVVGGGTGTFNPNVNTPNATFTHTGGSGPITLRWTLTDPGCGSSSADVVVTIVTPPATPSITATPTNVCGNTAGNQASGPIGAAAYAWTITQGTITSATNLQAITYTAAASGSVTLRLVVFNAAGCSATNSLNVPISSAPAIPTITLSPSSVCPNYPGNQATAPAGATTYAWTISNGTITGPAYLQTVTYVAGGSGSVTLGLRVFNAGGCSASNFALVPIVPAPLPPPGCSFQTNYFASLTFTDAPIPYAMGLAFDGTNYWSCSGNTTSGARLARYDASGVLLGTFSPGLDFRSVFAGPNCAVLARVWNDRTIYRQIAPGVFTNSGVTLTGGSLDSQSSVVMNGAGTEYIAMFNGTVSRWSPAGAYLGSVPLIGFGAVGGETGSYQNRGIAAAGSYWLTYNASRILSVWDTAGNRVTTATLSGAGVNTLDSAFSFSYCNGKVFVVDVSNGLWRGYDVCAGGARVAVFGAPSGGASWNSDVQSKILGAGSIAQVDAFMVTSGNPVPTLASLRKYQSVLVYSDSGFNDNVAFGNVLADYVDQGGGVVIATFAFYSSGGLSMQGRLVTGGYLPFTTAGQAGGSGLTMVKDLPAHPILDGVASFNGGASSFHNSSITTANGAALIAHWNNGQPLVGAREAGPGRVVGLNFYPPSSNALSSGWMPNTDGGRLMANALLWAGKEPPVILSGPSNRLAVAGATVTFNVAAVGTAPLAYQWRKDGANLPVNTSNYAFTATLASAGIYSVIVSNAYGAAFSSNATLAVISSTNLTLTATDTGWYDATGGHAPGNANYIVGNYQGQTYRNWFTFSIPPLLGPITRAELRVNTYSNDSPTGSEIYQLRQVTTPVATLSAGGSGLIAIYNDLADGPMYAARAFVPGESSRFVSIPLNQTLKTAVAGATGSAFAIGGEIVTLDGNVNTDEDCFSFSSGAPGDVQLLLTVGTGDAPVAGYFTDLSPAATGMAAPITNAGFIPVLIGDIATQNFSGLRLLVINEANNGTPSPALLSRLPAIQSWVEAGGRLIVHDRGAGLTSPNPFLIGSPGLGTVSFYTAALDVIDPATTLVTAGAFGIITNASLDGGSSSAHGYVPAGSLPAKSRGILSIGGDSNQVAGFSYPLGAGFVYYSTIPLDCYLAGGGCEGSLIAPALQTIYTPNVLTYMHALNPPLRFRPPVVAAGGALPLLLGTADNSPIGPDRVPQIRVYSSTNVAAPLLNWNLLGYPLPLSDGVLRVDGIIATNQPPRFFRAVENP